MASGFSVSFDIQFGPVSPTPADGVSFVLFEQAGNAIPVWACAARGSSHCYTSGVRFAFPTLTYNGGASSAYIRVGVGASSSGLATATDANLSPNTAFLSTATFGSAYTIATNDKWSYTLSFLPGGNGGAANQVLYSVTRGAASQSFSATVDINSAINTAPSIGGGFAWLGFSGGTGGSTEEAWVSNVRFLTRCPPSAYAATKTYNITESWSTSTGGVYTARCQPGFCGLPTSLACDAATATLTGAYPVCTPLGLPSGQQPMPLRAELSGTTTINVSCTAGFVPDPAVTTTAWALGSCTLTTGSSNVSMPNATTFSCIPSGAAAVSLMQPVDPRWWLTSDAAWGTTSQGTSAPLLSKLQAFSGGMAFYSALQVRVGRGAMSSTL